MQRQMLLAAASVATFGCVAGLAHADPARCYTTEDGEYDCEFVATDGSGSFEISAPGKPSFSLIIDAPGIASGFGNYGTGRNVPLPGTFHRSEDDGACWVNDATSFEICAW
jgi:hypothetical protein